MTSNLIERGTMHLTKMALIAMALAVSACSDPSGVTIQWSPPTQFDDGGALPDNGLTEYRVYVNQEMVQQIEPHLTEYFLELPSGEWQVTISAVVGGIESRLSDPLDVIIE
jgi:hypothetical protein